jgi:hypothetical protein
MRHQLVGPRARDIGSTRSFMLCKSACASNETTDAIRSNEFFLDRPCACFRDHTIKLGPATMANCKYANGTINRAIDVTIERFRKLLRISLAAMGRSEVTMTACRSL